MPPQLGSSLQRPEPGSGASQLFTWEEIGLHAGQKNSKQEKWLVINRKVYDISQFQWRHPGGTRVISHYAGQDATDAFTAFHKDEDLVQKYLHQLLIGELAPDQPNCEPIKNEMLVNDFRELYRTVKKMGLLKPSYLFFAIIFLHAFLLDIAAWLTIWFFGKSWMPFLAGIALFTTAQIQYGFFQHDLGHVSVFQKPKWNRRLHFILTAVLKLGKKKKKYMPYKYQHTYFSLLAPMIFVIFMQLTVFRFTILRKKWMELIFIVLFNIRVCLMYVPIMGFKSFMAYYWLARFLESNWFLWVSQMNHIPMNIDYDKNLDWVSTQLSATCNVDQSLFNDWYTGHLNFQIEHHLFPTMPRHNYWKVAPLVKSLCAKHGVQYLCKPLLTAFADILSSLKESSEHWEDAYLHG
ncbi:UNVERIFIED_CONTAM: hypothetical protein K2H54_062358 [Gekko kuhli]